MTASTAPAADLRQFALRTKDAAWIRRHNGRTDNDGRVFVSLPAAAVEEITFAGKPWLRHKFADCPKDFPNSLVMCPAKWVA
jgi:hypothetical protein